MTSCSLSVMFPFVLLLLATRAIACPTRSPAPRAISSLITAPQLLLIAPSSNACAASSFPDECRTAGQATPFINAALATYGISHPAEIAAVLSLMAFETGDFKYNKNHFPAPGRPGQGTRNMQSATFNLLYARSVASLQPQLSLIVPDGAADNIASLPPTTLNAIRQLVLDDEVSDFGSAAWFLTTQCPPSIRQALQLQGEVGWMTYIQTCVGTTVTDDRKAYWLRAVAALNAGPSLA